MTVLTILGSIAAIVVAVITIWNTAPVGRLRVRVHRAIEERRGRRHLAKEVASFASEPALIEIEDRFSELATAYESHRIPRDLADLCSRVFRLADESPMGRPFRYGTVAVHRDMNAMTIQRGQVSITGQEWLDAHRIPPPPRSVVRAPSSPLSVIKD